MKGEGTRPTPLEAQANELLLAIGQLRRRLRAEEDPGGFNLSQMSTLVRLQRNGWMTTADLARAEAMKPQSMGTILTGFEAKGLVQRRPHPTDRRQIQFSLTEAGMAARWAQNRARREWLGRVLARLTPAERKALDQAIVLIRRLGES